MAVKCSWLGYPCRVVFIVNLAEDVHIFSS